MTGYASIDKPWTKYYTEEEYSHSIPKCRIADFLFQRIENFLDYTALDFFGRKISYAELRDNVEETARALSALDIASGEIVGVCLPNIPEMIYLFYAISKIGAVANMIPRFTGIIGRSEVNIAGMTSKSKGDVEYTIFDLDNAPAQELIEEISEVPGVFRVREICRNE